MPHDQGYAKAKSLLQEHFGNSLKIASAYMEKVLTWPVLKPEEVKALQAYGFLLRGCCNAMGEVGAMHELANMLTCKWLLKNYLINSGIGGETLPVIYRISSIAE